jgi:hypothetical protein
VVTTLDADEDGEGAKVDNFAVHLQFLEEYFRVILPGIDAQALEYLNNLVVEVYAKKGIHFGSDFSRLNPEDYPIFDDLYGLIKEKLAEAKIDYDYQSVYDITYKCLIGLLGK